MSSLNRIAPALLVLALSSLTASCEEPASLGPPFLSEWEIFQDGATQTTLPGYVLYELNAPLFSDYASKHRFIHLPVGTHVSVDAAGEWTFPEGAMLVKTFGFLLDQRDPSLGERIIETRLLVLEGGVWTPYVYIWDEDMSDAALVVTGRRIEVSFTDLAGEVRSFGYRVPSRTQCGNCHGGTGATDLLGPSTQQLDREVMRDGVSVEQLQWLVEQGVLDGMPPAVEAFPDPFDTSVDVERRARAYLDSNCASCHNDDGAARQSGLWLGAEITDPIRLGVCKPPVAAGRGTGGRRQVVHPGDPDDSVLVFRVESDEPGVKMPELPTLLVHTEGAALMRAWIAAMPPLDCSAP